MKKVGCRLESCFLGLKPYLVLDVPPQPKKKASYPVLCGFDVLLRSDQVYPQSFLTSCRLWAQAKRRGLGLTYSLHSSWAFLGFSIFVFGILYDNGD